MKNDIKIDNNTLITRVKNELTSELDGEVIMMNTDIGKYFNFNKTASAIWIFLEKPATFEKLCDYLVSIFDISREQCDNEALEFIKQMFFYKLLEIQND